jgi:hypothetical protein
MAQATAQVGTVERSQVRSRRAAQLFKIVTDRVISAYRGMRERDELAAAASVAHIGRETGVRC